MTTINFRLTDVVREASPDRDAAMNDAFVGHVAAFRELWGEPRMKRDKKSQAAFWELPNGSVCRSRMCGERFIGSSTARPMRKLRRIWEGCGDVLVGPGFRRARRLYAES